MREIRLYQFVRFLIRALVFSILAIVIGFGGSVAEAKFSQRGSVEVGFTGVPPQGFQNVLLNVIAVQINPNAAAGPGNNKWQIIPVPTGVFGTGGRPGDLQIDLNTIQSVPQLFNTAQVRPGDYVIAELILDPNNPGTLVPNCPNAGATEGCINYPIQLQNAGNPIFATISNVSPPKNGLALLVLQLKATIVNAPIISGNPYLVSVTMTAVNPAQTLATVSGTVTSTGTAFVTGKKKKLRQLVVTAEQVGTNNQIISAPVLSNCPQDLKPTCFTMALPAGAQYGSYYDLAVSGGTAKYAATRTAAITPGTSTPAIPFSTTGGQKLGTISGAITDLCSSTTKLVGATIQLLIPPDSNPTADCETAPGECVSVATTNSDSNGNFPLPGTINAPSQFNNIPILPASGTYTMMVSMPGYDTVVLQAQPQANKKGGLCTINGTPSQPCSLALTSAIISGTLTISTPPTGQSTIVQVFAEDHGTNKIESALPMPLVLRGPTNNAPFALNVPSSVASFDLFATAIDNYQGISDPYQGHTIEVASNVLQPGPPTATGCKTSAPVTIGPLNCIGHGSVTGNVSNADLGTSVVLSKGGVQITQMPVQNIAPLTPSTNKYAFCAPADSYTLEPFELKTPTPGTVPISAPTSVATGNTAAVTIAAAPTITASPTGSPTPSIKCPSTCSYPDGSCPGICNNVSQQLQK